MLGVSRPSLREAVRTLQARGRLLVKHGQGIFVERPDSVTELRRGVREAEIGLAELFAMREVLEVPAATWAAERITPDEVTELEEILNELDGAFDEAEASNEPPDVDRLAGLDAQFHLGIAAMSGNQFLAQTSNVLHDMLLAGMETTLLIPGRREKSRWEHRRILTALGHGDGKAAVRAVRGHIAGARRAAMDRIAREQEATEG